MNEAFEFYHGVLGLEADPGRPHIPSIDGHWMDVGGTAQIHLMGVDGLSKFAEGPGRDPSDPHVALAVPDIQEAKDLDLHRHLLQAGSPAQARPTRQDRG